MKRHIDRSKNVRRRLRHIGRVILFAGVSGFGGLLASSCAVSPARTSGLYTPASQETPSQTAYIPPNGRGPVVVILSGATGPRLYDAFAAALAKEGYYVVLLDGNEVRRNAAGEASLRRAIEQAQKAPNAIPGKIGSLVSLSAEEWRYGAPPICQD
jgi:hypothetical protein